MKKYFALFLFSLLLFTKPVSADVLPEGQEAISICTKFTDLSDFPEHYLVTVSVLPNGSTEVTQITEDTCIKGFYKLADNRVFGVLKKDFPEEDFSSIKDFRDDRLILTDEKSWPDASKNVTSPTDIKSYEVHYEINAINENNNVIDTFKSVDKIHYKNGDVYTREYDANGEMTNETLPNRIFTDVTSDTPYAKAILYLKNEGYIHGYDDGSFKSNQPIVRAEFAKMIMNALKKPEFSENCVADNLAGESYVYFPDVAKNLWYSDYICAAKRANFIKGYPDGMFKPGLDINLAEAYKIGLTAKYNPDNFDETEGQNWYDTYMNYAYDKELSLSKSMDPGKPITRGQMAQMLYLMLTK